MSTVNELSANRRQYYVTIVGTAWRKSHANVGPLPDDVVGDLVEFLASWDNPARTTTEDLVRYAVDWLSATP